MSNEKNWCMIFSNDEIKRYLIQNLEGGVDVRYIVNDEYVEGDCLEGFEYVTFDGEKQLFYLSFMQSQTSLFIGEYEILFIDDEEKQYYTSSDVDDCIVYEGKLNDKSHKQILELLLDFVNIFNGAYNIEIDEEKLLEEKEASYPKHSYLIKIANPRINQGKYKFDNIMVVVRN